jgi:hypothetical protein
MTDDQYKAMVDDIADAVVKKMGAGGKAGKSEKQAKPAGEKKEGFDAIGSVRQLRDQSSRFLATIPDYPAALAGVGGALGYEIRGEQHGLAWMLQWLLIGALAGIAAEYAVRALLTRIRKRWQATHAMSPARRYAACVGIDLLATAAMFVAAGFMSDIWLPAQGVAAELGSKLLTLYFVWRVSR